MSRNRLMEKGLRREDLRQAYLRLKTVRGVAAETGISPKTVRKYLREAGVVMQPGRRLGVKSEGPIWHSSCLANWLRDHPDVLLPRSVKEISALTGCNPNEVKTYLYRRRGALKRRVKALPFGQSPYALPDANGVRIPFTLWKRVTDVKVGLYDFSLEVTVELRSGHARQFHLNSLQELERFLAKGPKVADPG